MKKKVGSILLAIVMLIACFQITPVSAATGREYKEALLKVDMNLIRKVGQQSYAGPCGCYAVAYARTILDGSVHNWYEYSSTGQSWTNTSQAVWSRASYKNVGYGENQRAICYEEMYLQITRGKPVVVMVNGNPQHFVTVVGFQNVSREGSLSASNFLILDPQPYSGEDFKVVNMSPRYDIIAKAGGNGIVAYGTIVTDETVDTTNRFSKLSKQCTKDHSDRETGFNEGYCSECGEWQPEKSTLTGTALDLFKGTSAAKNDTYIRVHPYVISDSSHGEPATVLPKGARVIVDGAVTNGLGNIWLHVSYGNVSGYVYSENLEKKSSSMAKHYLGIDGLLDGKNADDIKGYGTCDVYVNGKRVANDVNDFYAEYAPGNEYMIRDIKPNADIEYKGCTGLDYYSVVVNDDQTVETCPAGTIPTSPANGSGVTLRFQFTTKNKWSSVPTGEYYFVHVATGKQLDVQSGGDYNNCNVALYGPNTSDAERWVISGSATGYKIKPKCTASRVLNSYGDSVSSGNNVNIWDSVDDNTQRWVFEEVSGGYVIRNAANKTCVLDVSDNSVFVNTYNSSSKTQIWKLVSTAQKPTITKQPTQTSVTVGTKATFSVTATGSGTLTYQWQAYNPNTAKWTNSSSASAKTATLTITTQSAHNGFKFRCIVKDGSGNTVTSNAATLTLNPKFTAQPQATSVTVGSTATFQVVAAGAAPFTYQWQAFNPATGSWVNSGSASAKTAKLSITAQAGHNGFKFRCIVTDANGTKITSNAATLTVTAALQITKQPAALTVKAGESASFSVTATGTGLTYQWQAYNPSTGTWVNSGSGSAKTSKLTITAQKGHNGFKFRCIVKDSAGKTVTSSAVTLTVLQAVELKITKQPEALTVKVGASASFSVTATGTGLTYQWQAYNPYNGTWVNSGAASAKTAKLTITAQSAHNGFKFRCIVKDSTGKTVTSSAVTLTVLK